MFFCFSSSTSPFLLLDRLTERGIEEGHEKTMFSINVIYSIHSGQLSDSSSCFFTPLQIMCPPERDYKRALSRSQVSGVQRENRGIKCVFGIFYY